MDETLKRRLIGALVLLGGAVLLSLLLPRPSDTPSAEVAGKQVVIDLTRPQGEPAPEPADETAVETPEAGPPAEEVPPPPPELTATETPQIEAPEARAVPAPVPSPSPAPASKSAAPGHPASTAVKPAPVPVPRKPWYLQIGSFVDSANAQQALAGYQPLPGFISLTDTRAGTRYRAWLGPYASKDAALAAQHKLGAAGASLRAVDR